MTVTELAKQLGISRQMCNRLKNRGMPTDTLESAIKWRRQNLDVTQTKSWRIDGNSGSKPVSNKTSATVYSSDEKKIIGKTLTNLLPNLYFGRVDWLAIALKEAGVTVTGEQVIEIQDTLFSSYLEEIWFGKLKIETDADFMLPPLFEMRLDSKERKAVIASIDELLSVDSTAE